jgi:hypothetical protein
MEREKQAEELLTRNCARQETCGEINKWITKEIRIYFPDFEFIHCKQACTYRIYFSVYIDSTSPVV